ncbi:hypothetical protein [Zwartia sp.]|uniref:hypothetical protein n=1 Tax=Zwartia sp. TaxID=2978004 RepID=UPI0028AC211F|nr:hypothetical protein [Zwartia sp.]
MLTRNTWIVCSLMSFAVQLDKSIRAQALDPLSLGTALLIAIIMGAGWAFVAGWIRTKLLPSLADDYARNIQIGFGAFSLLLIAGLIYKLFTA